MMTLVYAPIKSVEKLAKLSLKLMKIKKLLMPLPLKLLLDLLVLVMMDL
jgi:hypothetical protein